MSRKRILWQIYPSYLFITVLAVSAMVWFAVDTQERLLLRMLSDDLLVRAELFRERTGELLIDGERAEVNRISRILGKETSTRITIMTPTGEVVGDTEENPLTMDNHGTRPEVIDALAAGFGTATRFSNTLQKRMMYVAIPYKDGEQIYGVVRTSIPVTSIGETRKEIWTQMTLGGLAIAILAALVSLYVSRRISRPLEQLRLGAERFSSGDLTTRLAVPESVEIGGLAEAMNQMAAQLNDRICTITQQRNEQEAILSSMTEGLIAVDNNVRILNMNKAAADFFNVELVEPGTRTLHEAVRNSTLQEIVSGILGGEEEVAREIVVPGDPDMFLQASGSILRDADGEGIGAVVVLNDVTLLRELENMRRDFVANVSHELKTPITSIKGFAETLQNEDIRDSDDMSRFLSIISRHADRLSTLIEDLLVLSRIEQGPEMYFERTEIKSIVHSAAITCENKARQKSIELTLESDDDTAAEISPHLMEQAIVNLMDNAIKYSEPDSVISIKTVKIANEISVSVTDTGCGIEDKHLPRLFERFYRVDRARSRELGGTGLGLAIVKHIAIAHGGRVAVQSEPGKGSTFSITVPVSSQSS